MIHRQKQRGFTIVELIVVIVVIAILAAITLVAYDGIQKRAMDAKIISTLNDAGKALLIKASDGVKPTGTGYWSNAGSVDGIVSPDYMPTGYRKDLTSTNVKVSNVGNNKNNNVYRYYNCTTGGYALYASLNKPSDDDVANLMSIRSSCGNTSVVPVADDYVYNYAKVFK